MNASRARIKVESLLAQCGVAINGHSPWDLNVHNEQCFARILRQPSLGLGESYMEGWWDCQQLDQFFFRLLRHLSFKEVYKLPTLLWYAIRHALFNQQNTQRSREVAEKHYNLSTQLYGPMLGESMAYTCAYWRDADQLDAAQYAKYDLICRKAQLQTGEKVLELGCGWGGFAKYAAENYGVEVTAVNISSEQVKFARQLNEGLPVQIHQCDYRLTNQYNPNQRLFDKVVSIGMCEHVGYRNYPTFLKLAHQQLKPQGLFVLHTIGKNYSVHFSDPWVRKYIFPHGMLPSIKLLSAAIEGQFVVEDLHNFGADYDRTLMAWDANFTDNWENIKQHYDRRFYRMWRYYLLSCAGGFRSRDLQLWQWVLSPQGVLHGYRSVR